MVIICGGQVLMLIFQIAELRIGINKNGISSVQCMQICADKIKLKSPFSNNIF